MKHKISRLGRLLLEQSSWAAALLQSVLILVSLVLAWLLRFDFSWKDQNLLLATAPVLLLVRLLTMKLFRLDHGWWQYTGVNEALDVAKAVTLGSVLFYLVTRFGLELAQFPRSLYIIEALLTALLLMAVRILSRALVESVREDLSSFKRVLIVGAGFGAQMLIREIKRPGSGYLPVGCVDDDLSKLRVRIMGVPVLGTADQIPDVVTKYAVSEVLIAVPSATSSEMRRFVDICEGAKVRFKTVPALRDFLTDQPAMNQLREVKLEDLLGREPVKIDLGAVRLAIEGRMVLVTGAAGSIGSEICRQVLDFRPRKLICVDQNETGIFYLQRSLKQRGGEVSYTVGDFNDTPLMKRLLDQEKAEVVFHAAAYKHVPVMEQNVAAALRNNVFGLTAFLDLAESCGCESFILISSDKAVNPTSVMGATKRIGELIIAARPSAGLRCVSVRFGNVLGSNGSLIPILQEQLRRGEPLTITDPEIRRFFMTTEEAVSLVLQAFAIGNHRDILVLDMGDSLRILDIARTLIRLSGKSEAEVPIVFTGLRSGEKFFEELFYDSEKVLPSTFSKIKRTKGLTTDWPDLIRQMERLRRSVIAGDELEMRSGIREIVPEYTSNVLESLKGAASDRKSAVGSGRPA